MCTTCALIPKQGIKTHKCHRNNKVFNISSNVTCLTENVIYRITCEKPQCQNFTYIGETKRRFVDRFSEHRGYVSRKCMDQVCGQHFNQKGHKYEDMLPIIIEKLNPKNDSFLRQRREKHWINTYESIEFGANRKSWRVLRSPHHFHFVISHKKWNFEINFFTVLWRVVDPKKSWKNICMETME